MDNNLIGKKFGKLTVIEKSDNYIQPSGRIREMWKCKCECGNIKTYRKRRKKQQQNTTQYATTCNYVCSLFYHNTPHFSIGNVK